MSKAFGTPIILLNGASSSGKTSIARNIQALSAQGWLILGVDTITGMMPELTPDLPSLYLSLRHGKNIQGSTMQIEVTPQGKSSLVFWRTWQRCWLSKAFP